MATQIKLVYLHLLSFVLDIDMAKVGYIFKANSYDEYDADKEWMCQYGCVQVIEESVQHETLRPRWKQLMTNLERGDELVVSKFSNAVRGLRELAALIELCRIKWSALFPSMTRLTPVVNCFRTRRRRRC